MEKNNVKVVCYGVRNTETEFFEGLNKDFGYQLTIYSEYLTSANLDTTKGHDAVLVRANCDCSRAALEVMKANGVKYILTRTVGFDHVDVQAAHDLGLKVARVAGYSPNAISELAVGTGLGLLRNLFFMAEQQRKHAFKVEDFMFAKEVRNSTIGVIGTGRIGYETAKAWKGLGAKVVGYDVYPSEKAKEVLDYVALEQLIKESDLITLHCPYIKDQNHHMVNAEFISKMKKGAVLINAARGPLMDTQAVIDGVKSNHLRGVGLDVLEAEGKVFGKDFAGQPTPDALTNDLLALYPRVIVTPHVGSNTDEAVKNMVEVSYQNLADFLAGTKCPNEL